MKAILYARVSSQKQAERGHSLRQQIGALRNYAKAHGIEVVAEVVDDGYSGSKYDRPD